MDNYCMLQQKLVEMLTWFHAFCKENDLQYYVLYGTMLGAAREKGMIPWDDDVDVGMPREDYNRIIQLLKEKKDHYVVESLDDFHKGYRCLYAKLYDVNTTLIERAKHPYKKGVYIDIFPLDGIGNTYEEALKNLTPLVIRAMLYTARICVPRKGRNWFKNLSTVIAGFLPVNDEKLAQSINKLSSKRRFSEFDFVCNTVSAYRQKDILHKKVYGRPTEYTFAGTTVYGVEDCEAYLTHLYGDWRKLPPVEKRVSLHEHLLCDLESPCEEQ